MSSPNIITPGTVLFARSACDHDCIYHVPVLDRTAERAKVFVRNRSKWVKIYREADGSEYLMAQGRHSMAPVFRGPGLREDTGEYAHYRKLRGSGTEHGEAFRQSCVALASPAEVAAALAPFVSPEDLAKGGLKDHRNHAPKIMHHLITALSEKAGLLTQPAEDAPLESVPQIQDLQEALDLAAAAVRKTLNRIAGEPAIAWYCGHMTEIYDKQIAALAALTGEHTENLEAKYEPHPDASNPAEPPALERYEEPWTVKEVRIRVEGLQGALDRIKSELYGLKDDHRFEDMGIFPSVTARLLQASNEL